MPVPFAAADFDGDGHVDLAVGSRYLYAVDNHVLIFRGKGDGTMLPPTHYEVGWQPAWGRRGSGWRWPARPGDREPRGTLTYRWFPQAGLAARHLE